MMATAPQIRCPRCECGHLDTVDQGIGWGGRPFRVFFCRHCGKRFRRFMPREGSVAPPVAHAEPVELETREIVDLEDETADSPPVTYWVYGKPKRCVKCGEQGRVYNTRRGYRYVKCYSCKATWKEGGRAVPQR